MKKIISLCALLGLSACTQTPSSVKIQATPTKSAKGLLTKYESKVVDYARESLVKSKNHSQVKLHSVPSDQIQSYSNHINKPARVNLKAYNAAKEAYGRFQSSLYPLQEKSIACETMADPTPSDVDLLSTDLYTKSSPEVIEVARELTSPKAIYEFVRYNIKNEVLFGASRTSAKTLRLRSGSTADKVNLMLSLLRANEIPSYFVVGEVYLTEPIAKRLFKVSNTANLFNVIFSFFDNYFLTENGAGTDIYRMISGVPYWVMPHVWVRAFHDGSWHTYDPTQLDDVFDSLGEGGYLSFSETVNWDDWFFQPDANGQYVKPRTVIDDLLQQFKPSRNVRYLDLSSFSNEMRYDGVLSNLEPCPTSRAISMESSNFEYRASVTVNDLSSVTKIDFNVPLAKLSENQTYLSHSAGLRADITTGTGGNVEFRVGDQLIQSFSATSGTEFKLSASISGPSFWSSSSFSDEFPDNYKAADVFNFEFGAGPVSATEVSRSVEDLLLGIKQALAPRYIMAKMLRLAGVLYGFKSSQISGDIYRLRKFRSVATSFLGTYSNGGGIKSTDETDKEFGQVPLTGSIAEMFSGYLLSTDTSIFTEEGMQEVKVATEEDLISGSEAEATIWEELYGVRGYSANRVLQLGAKLKSGGGSYTLINGLQFNAADNSHISSKIDSGSQFYTHWPYIDSTYGDLGGTFWALNKEVTDDVGGAVSYGYVVFRKTLFDPGIAAFGVLSTGHSSVQGDLPIVGQLPLSEFEQAIASGESFGPKSERGESATNHSTITDFFGSLIGGKSRIFGGGSGKYSNDQIPSPQGTGVGGSTSIGGVQTGCASSQPVDMPTGRMWHTLTDFNLKGRAAGTALKFERTYYTLPQYNTTGNWVANGDLGKGWVHTYDTRLLTGDKVGGLLTMGAITAATQDVVWISTEGNPILFSNSGSATIPVYAPPEGFIASLSATSTTYVLTLKGNLKYTFKRDLNSNYNGRLISIEEPHAETIQLSYDGSGKLSEVSTNFAGTLTFTRDGDGHLIKVYSAKNGLTYTYTYTAGRLVSSTDFDGNVTFYEYNSSQPGTAAQGLLTAIVDPLGRRLEFDYYQNGKVFREKEPGGAVQSYQYAPYEYMRYTRKTAPNGFTTDFRYDDKFRVIEIVYPDGGRQIQKWNSVGRIEFERDPMGNTTHYTYDSRGNRTGVKKPLDLGYRETSYNQTFDLPTSSMPLDGSVTNFSINSTTGDITQVSRFLVNTSVYKSFTYDALGGLNSVTTNVNSYSHVTNANGQRTFEFDSRNPQDLAYDGRGRLIERNFKNGRILRYGYDNFDRVTHIEDTHGPDVTNVYDAGGRLRETTRTSAAAAQTAKFEYDDRDRMIASINFAGERTEYKYDVVGVGCVIRDKPTKIISPEGKVTRFEYDFAGRKTREFLPSGDQTSYKYNVGGDLIAVIDPQGLITQYEYDGNGRLSKTLAQSAMSQVSSNGTQVGYGGEETEFFYDAGDRLVRKEQKLVNESHVTGRYVTEYFYDSLDRIERQLIQHKRGTKVVETFDDIGYQYLPILGESYPTFVGNKWVELRFSYQTQPPYSLVGYSVTPTADGLSIGLKSAQFRVVPDMNGPMALIEREGALLIKNGYDQAGRLLSSVGKLGSTSHSVALTYDDFARRDSITHSNGLTGSYAYDDTDRVTSIGWSGASISKSEAMTYNKDNLITQVVREIGTFNYGYSENNEVTSIGYSGSEYLPIANVNTTLTHDLSGNILSYRGESFSSFNNFTNQVGSKTLWPDYSGLGRMIGSKVGTESKSLSYYPDGKIKEFNLYSNTTLTRKVSYYYDGLGRRIAKVKDFTSEADSKITYTHLGAEDKILLADVTKSGATVEALYVDGQGIDDHLFEVNSSTGAKGYARDHLGSVLNSSALGYASVYGLYGETLGTAAATNSAAEPVVYGFTGRDLDPETGYYYYRQRYYDPYTARFLTKDPLGPHEGGSINPYTYADNDPVNKTDPTGESPLLVGAAIGALIGAYLTPTPVDTPITPLGEAGRMAVGATAGAVVGAALGVAGAVVAAPNANPYIRIGEGKFPEPYSQRISIGNTPGKKFEIGMSPAGRIDVKFGPLRITIRPGGSNMCE